LLDSGADVNNNAAVLRTGGAAAKEVDNEVMPHSKERNNHKAKAS